MHDQGRTILPPVLFVALAFGVVLLLWRLLGERAFNDPDLQRVFGAMLGYAPQLAELDASTLQQILMCPQLLPFLLITPLVGSVSIAGYGIAGENVRIAAWNRR